MWLQGECCHPSTSVRPLADPAPRGARHALRRALKRSPLRAPRRFLRGGGAGAAHRLRRRAASAAGALRGRPAGAGRSRPRRFALPPPHAPRRGDVPPHGLPPGAVGLRRGTSGSRAPGTSLTRAVRTSWPGRTTAGTTSYEAALAGCSSTRRSSSPSPRRGSRCSSPRGSETALRAQEGAAVALVALVPVDLAERRALEVRPVAEGAPVTFVNILQSFYKLVKDCR